MKQLLLLTIGTIGIIGLMSQSALADTTLYSQNFESSANGSGADGWYGYAGGDEATPSTAYVTNYLGSQDYMLTWDASADTSYSYAGIGGMNYSAGISPGGASLSDITLSISLAENGSTSPDAFALYVDQYGTSVVSGQSYSWQEQFNPVTTTDGSFTTFTTTLDLGTGVQGVYDSSLPISIGIDASSGFPLATGNQMIVDNMLVTAVPEPGTMALASVGGVALLFLRRRAVR